jgi:hypothetical protein
LSVVRESGFATTMVATLTKNHADTCSEPTLQFHVVDPVTGESKDTTDTGPRICAARDFKWSGDHTTSLWVKPTVCLSWSGFTPVVCMELAR